MTNINQRNRKVIFSHNILMISKLTFQLPVPNSLHLGALVGQKHTDLRKTLFHKKHTNLRKIAKIFQKHTNLRMFLDDHHFVFTVWVVLADRKLGGRCDRHSHQAEGGLPNHFDILVNSLSPSHLHKLVHTHQTDDLFE